MSTEQIQSELRRAERLRMELEGLVYERRECKPDERGWFLLAHWSLVIEHHVSIVGLLTQGLCGSACALLRPVVESTIRGHHALFCSDEVLKTIRSDDYRVNFGTIGKEIDERYGLETLVQDFLCESSKILHSYTHGGLLQVQRRFKNGNLESNYQDAELIELIRTATSGMFMLTNMVTKHFGFEAEWKRATELYVEWGRNPVS